MTINTLNIPDIYHHKNPSHLSIRVNHKRSKKKHSLTDNYFKNRKKIGSQTTTYGAQERNTLGRRIKD